MDSLDDLRTLSIEEIKTRSRAIVYIRSLLRIKYSQLFQSLRFKWLKEGDTCSGFFHACVKSRGRRNAILALKIGVGWIEWVSEIRQDGVEHFFNIFKGPNAYRPHLHDIVFYSIFKDAYHDLRTHFSLHESDFITF